MRNKKSLSENWDYTHFGAVWIGTDSESHWPYEVTPCPHEPCELHHGQNYSIAVEFTENVADELKLDICGYIGPICVPFPTDTPKQEG